MKVRRIILTGIVILVAAYFAFVTIPTPVNKHYEGGIFTKDHLLKKVPITLHGNVYRGVFNINEFVGTITISGKQYKFTTAKFGRMNPLKRIRLRIASLHSQYPYVGDLVGANDHGPSPNTANLFLSSDFAAIFGTTNQIESRYGKLAFFRTPINLDMTFHQ